MEEPEIINEDNFPELSFWIKWTIEEGHASGFLILRDGNDGGRPFYHPLLSGENMDEIIKRYKNSGNAFVGFVPVKKDLDSIKKPLRI